MEVLIANPRGFCAGVERAISIVDLATLKYPEKKIFVFHEIVHNKRVLDDFIKKGVCFVEDLSAVEDNSVIIFSAHGVSEKIEARARSKNLIVIDATCPLVTKVHKEALLHQKNSRQIIIVGNKSHPEIVGTIGRVSSVVHIIEKLEDIANLNILPETEVAYITQTTLSVDYTKKVVAALKEKFPHITGNSDICYATQNRQDAVKALAKQVDLMLIVGSRNSSNSKNLNKTAQNYCGRSYLIDDKNDIKLDWFCGVKKVGISSGASAPDVLIEEIIQFLKENFHGVNTTDFLFKEELVKFKLPHI